MKTYNCIYCGKENRFGYSKLNKYCDINCRVKYQWEFETKSRIEQGLATSNSAYAIKRYLIEKHGEKCFECPVQDTWNNKKLILQLDHIDGDSDNNHLSNLRLLCPNCHSQTETYGGKGLGSRNKNKKSKRNNYLRKMRG